ncbi:serine/threonine protein kinase [Gloeothece citriformis PCC 7424]|uniref:non-specific serine/threonine protein kinase n=1 Tax=Gloeothece citriformis (strain PCC 7424) TaxID=65393 RepID=B7KDB0_GLOC7|nr:serine/threonine-protein kinase [Gloeothece citriformis]ACK68930.1 serine/threonine protein kinase [Gloeothece citriformis PCC 7424]
MNNQTIFQRYHILHKLGEGGFGTTYLAEDLQMPSRRRCVVKQLKPLTHEPQIYQLIKERFQKEAAILEQLSSQNRQIPQLYGYFEDQGQFYLVQEYIEGDTLSSLMEKKAIFDENTVKEILLKLLPVLNYVHNSRIVHRDIKPDNIIIRRSDNSPVLIDFGAVKESMGTMMTPTGSPTSSIVIGTPGFMPSEQSAGWPVYATDLYALGLTAIYLLTGKTPQELETDPLTGEIIWKHYVPQLSENLTYVLDKAIKSFHKERFLTAQEMLNALEPLSSSPDTVVVCPPTQVASISSSKSNGLKNLLIGGLIVIPLALGAYFWQNQESQNGTIEPNSPQKSPISSNTQNSEQQEPNFPTNQNQFDLVQFPQPSCGDSLPSDFSSYPLNVYPVFIEFSQNNFQYIRQNFCQDSFAKIRQDTGEKAIQIASFSNLKQAQEFSEFIKNQVGSGEVGEPTLVQQHPDQKIVESNPVEGQTLDEVQAKYTIKHLYDLLSEKNYPQATQLFSPQLASQFNPDFFNQFQRVTVENLQMISSTDSTIEFTGENTYIYWDGSTQRELRSYTVSNINGNPKIVGSKFMRVIKFKS